MSRISALWTAGAVALLFAMIVGAVVLRPVLGVNADAQDGSDQTGITTLDQGETTQPSDNPLGWDDDEYGDDEWDDEDEDHEDYEDDDEGEEHENDD